MTIRVKISHGALVPLEPLPAEWADGRELELSVRAGGPTSGRAGPSGADAAAEEPWMTEEDFLAMQAAVDEHRREAKEWMRRRVGHE